MKYNPRLAVRAIQFVLWNGFADQEHRQEMEDAIPLLTNLVALFEAKGIARDKVKV